MIDPSSHFEEHHRRAGAHKYRDTTVGVSCLVIGVVVLFVLLRILYQPYLLGGPGGLLVAFPVGIIIATGLFVYGTRTLLRKVRHLPYS